MSFIIDLSPLLKQFKEEARRAIEANICVECKQPPTFYSDAGRKEYYISGLCEPCLTRLAPMKMIFLILNELRTKTWNSSRCR